MTVWVVDTSPLIFLANLDRLDLLVGPERSVYAPSAVYAEAGEREDRAFERIRQAATDWLVVRDVADPAASELLRGDLGVGEAEALVLARELNAALLVVDDLEARRFATRVGLRVIGPVGLLLAGKLRGDVVSLRAELERLKAMGFRVSDRIVEAVLDKAGETGR